VFGFDYDFYIMWFELVIELVGDLFGELFLYLGMLCE